tara:strand:+ start:289 stop:504 length:216 start_codon:yes stop_codon:yes gene_type:complete
MGDPMKLFVGECLVEVDEDAATNYQEKMVEEKTEELEKKTDELDEIETELKGLKSFLYARFGSSINLEEDK